MKKIFYVLFAVALLTVFTGCSLKYDLNPPTVSIAQYENHVEKKSTIYVIDQRKDKQFIKGITGLQNVTLKIGNVEDPIDWLARSLEKEFSSHGLNVHLTTDPKLKNSADVTLLVEKYQIINSRTSGFHPYVAYHTFSGKIQSTDSRGAIVSYFVYGKTPVWSMDEIQEPCFDMPSSILIKGIAAKINHAALHFSMTNAQLEELSAGIEKEIQSSSPHAYLNILELGSSNNPKANQYLKRYSESDDLIIRACAFSAMGMIGDPAILPYLQRKYSELTDIDRMMTLKSIGDIGTETARDILKEARLDPQYQDEYGFQFLVDLYLESFN